MKLIDPFRDPEPIKSAIRHLQPKAISCADQLGRPVQIMEVCGGHTHTLFKFGLPELLPKQIEFVHGPGCPVCVLPRAVIDQAIALATRADVIFTTFGDALRVPGSEHSLQAVRAQGADVRVLYSPADALVLAQQNPSKQVVFFAIGFETTMPSTALVIQQAAKQGFENFSVLSHHITIMPTLRALLDRDDVLIDGFIGPGHVSAIIGEQAYRDIADHYQKPLVISGFEPLDIVQSIDMLLTQLVEQRCDIENQYTRVVKSKGNQAALNAMYDVFAIDSEDALWRGLGQIKDSGAPISNAYAHFDAAKRFALPVQNQEIDCSGYCDQVMIGKLKPSQCPHFGKSCSPQQPMGALMVSTEGACSAYYRYRPLMENSEVV
ncbi:MAG: hydrogenase formation protein HypD [Pseudomonadales bacterium]|nr:hydrogenase formation protein HypD [Pseudomonadales bacterium]